MTLTEYLEDYASEDTKRWAISLSRMSLKKIPKGKGQEIARENIEQIKNSNRRDFRF